MKCILNVENFCQKSAQKIQSPENGARKICPVMGHINWTLMPVNSSIIYGSWSPGALLMAARAFSPLLANTWVHAFCQTSHSAILAPGSKAFKCVWQVILGLCL